MRRHGQPVGRGIELPRPAHAAKLFGNREARLQSIFVKTIAEMCTAKPCAVASLQVPEPGLGRNGRTVVDRMVVYEAADDCSFAWRLGGVEGHEKLGLGVKPLQPV